ncbi:MAG: TolC family protein [Kiritimatiellales bacterium]|nr:TolC family protein [Kiritimatiellales bacterium]
MKHKNTKDTKSSTHWFHLTLRAVCLGVFLARPASADPFGTNLTLQAALEYGAENNPQLQAAFNQWKGAEQNITVQKGLPDPTLSYGYYFESVETRVGPQNQSFGLSQKFPGFGKLALMKSIATDQTVAAEARYQREKLNLDSTIAQAYAELYYLKRSIDITQDRIRLVQDLEQIARTRYSAGAPMAPTLQAQLEMGRLEDRLASLNDMQKPYAARLNAALNRPSEAPVPWPANLPYRAVLADPEDLNAQARRTSPELAELTSRIEQGDHQLKLAKRERLPDFTLGVQYIDTGNAAMPVADSGNDPIIGTIGINLPLWIGKNHARIEAAAYQKTAAQLMLENREQTLDADIRQTLFKLRDADRKINLYKESLIPKAEQSLEVTRKSYEAGQMEFLNLIDAERMLLEFELARERALADHLIARAELGKLTGINFLTGENHETH